MFRRKRKKDEIDKAAEEILKILKKGVENIDAEGEKYVEEVRQDKRKIAKPPLIESRELTKFMEPLQTELEKVEKTIEKVKPKVETLTNLAPEFFEIREALNKDMERRIENLEKLESSISKFQEQKTDLNENIEIKQKERETLEKEILEKEEKAKVLVGAMNKLTLRKVEVERVVSQEKMDLEKVKDYLNRIMKIQGVTNKENIEKRAISE